MDKCEFIENCYFSKNSNNEDLKKAYCDNEPLRCARFMIYQSLGESKVPNELMPDEKMKAYEIIAEN